MFNQFNNTTGPVNHTVGEAPVDSREYWKRQLANAPPALVLPGDRISGSVGKRMCDIQSVMVPAALTRHLRDLGKNSGATSATVT